MSHNRTAHISLLDVLPQTDRLDTILANLDELHSAISEGEMTGFTNLNNREVITLLREMIYTAQESINELETREQTQPTLRIVEKIGKAG
ncbi:MAG: hypothetical protein ACPG7F_08905 [Aggregatilineales bacterium]